MTAPGDIPNLYLRLRVGSITGLVDGDLIATLPDSGPNVTNATQSNSSARPIYKTGVLNGQPVARFDGVTQHMTALTTAMSTTAVTMFFFGTLNATAGAAASARYTSFTRTDDLNDADDVSNFLTFRNSGNNHALYRDGVLLKNQAVTLLSPFSAVNRFDGTNARMWFNGTEVGSATASTGTFTSNLHVLGASKMGGVIGNECQNMDVAEILVYTRALTDAERADVLAYGQTTYGIGTVSHVGTGAVTAAGAANATSLAPAYPAGIAVDDYELLFVAQKPTSGATTTTGATVTTPSGWTALGSLGSSVTTAVANDVGPTKISVFGRVATVADTGTLSVTIAGADTSWAAIAAYRRALGTSGTWDVALASGEKTTGGASYSATMSTNPGISAGDHIFGALAIPTDVTTPAQFTAEALTATGATFAAVTEVAEPDTTTGTDMGGVLWRTNCTAGPASAAPVFTTTAATTNTAVYGPTVLVRLRETVAASTTSVEASVATAWGVLAGVSATKATAWNVTAVVTATVATAWTVTAPVTASAATAWAVRANVATSAATAWGVLAPVNTSTATAWNVRSAVAASSAQSWSVTTPVATLTGTSWAVAGAVTATTATAWSVASVVAAGSATAWSVLAPASSAVSSTWGVRAPVSTSADTEWSVAGEVSTSAATSWAVRSAVSASAGTTWGVLFPVEATAPTSWAVLSPVASTTATAWNVAEDVAMTHSTAWDVLLAVSATGVTSWTVRGTVTAGTATAWAVAEQPGTVTGTLATSWVVQAPVSAAASTSWAVWLPVATSAATSWVVEVASLAPVSASLSSDWAVLARVTVSAATAWATLGGDVLDLTFTAALEPSPWVASLDAAPWSATCESREWSATLDGPHRTAALDPARWTAALEAT